MLREIIHDVRDWQVSIWGSCKNNKGKVIKKKEKEKKQLAKGELLKSSYKKKNCFLK